MGTAKKKNVILARAAEPSTHAGLAAVAGGLGAMFPQYAPFAQAAMLIFGGIAAMKADK